MAEATSLQLSGSADEGRSFSSLCIPRLDLFLLPTDVLLHIDEFQDHGKDNACEHLKTHKSK